MKEKRYIIVEVECDVEFDAVEETNVLCNHEWEQLDKFSDHLYRDSYGWVTSVSMFIRNDPRKRL
jgi:hypothetical protein